MYSRRAMLRLGGVGTAVGLAGCAVPRADPGSRRQQAGVPVAGAPIYRRWLPAPSGTDETTDPGSATVRYVDLERAFERGEMLPVDAALSMFEFWRLGDWFGHEITDLEGILAFHTTPPTLVFAGDVSIDDAVDGLTDGGYESHESDGPWELYHSDQQRRLVAVGESGVVQTDLAAQSDEAVEDGTDRLRAILEARSGDRQRRHETDPQFASLTEHLGRGIRTTVGLERPAWLPEDGQWGTAVDAADGEYVRRAAAVAPGSNDDEIADAFADHFQGLWEKEPTVYANDGVADAFFATEAASPLEHVSDVVPPRATITFEYDSDDERGTVRHLAGDPIDLTRLTITVDGLTSEELQFDEGTLEPGTRFAIGGLPEDVVVAFRYELESGLEIVLDRFVASASTVAGTVPEEPTGDVDGE